MKEEEVELKSAENELPEVEKMDDNDHDDIGQHEKLMNELKSITDNCPATKRRVKALKKLQFQYVNMEVKFYEEIHALECKYNKLYAQLYAQRKRIVVGDYEPTDVECEWPSDDDDLTDEVKTKVKLESSVNEVTKNVTGIPGFWLTIFKNVDLLVDMVQLHDEPILLFLNDIEIEMSEDPMNFTLKFQFGPNPYFTNTVLTKTYDMRCIPDEQDPLAFGGPVIYRCRGCQINWNAKRNVTVRTVRKKQKHRSRGEVRFVMKVEKTDSFFNFFDPPIVPDDPKAEIDDATQSLLTNDFEIGNLLRERIVPQAVRYFTGEALIDEEEEEDDYEEEEISSDEQDDEDEDEDGEEVQQDKVPRRKGKSDDDERCKQQ